MDTVRVYVSEKGEALIRCNQCGRKKAASAADYRVVGKKLKVSCSCGSTFVVSFDWRRFYRKPVNLLGDYLKDGDSVGMKTMVVVDVSLGGIRIQTLHDHDLKVDDVIQVTFYLDNALKSLISRNAVIRKVHDRFVGAEFCDNKTDKALAFYVMP
jgi:hypothetical protein